MRIVRFLFLALAAWGVRDGSAKAVPIFVLAGQSNAAGQGLASEIPRESAGGRPEILYYRFDSDGRNGVLFNQKLPLSGTFGPEFQLASTLADALTPSIAVVKVALSATPLAAVSGLDWNPASQSELYDRLKTTVAAAQADLRRRGEQAELAAMFWMQGEQDAKSGNLGGGSVPPSQPSTANAYEANLTQFIQNLRNDWQIPDLPFFIGQVRIGDDPQIVTNPDSAFNTPLGEWDYTPTIQTAQAAVAGADPYTHFVPTTGFSQLTDYLHFDAAGQIALGRAFAQAYLASVPEPSLDVLLCSTLIFPTWRSFRCVRDTAKKHRQLTSNL